MTSFVHIVVRRFVVVALIMALFVLDWPLAWFESDDIPPGPQTVQAVGENMILFWDQAWIPTGWSCISCSPGDDFYRVFPRGEATYGGTGGATTTTHTASGTVNADSAAENDGTGTGLSLTSHTHTFTPTIVATNTLPSYRELKMIQYDTEGEPAEIPNGAIALFDASVSGDWSAYGDQTSYYTRGAGTSGGTGGGNTHIHDITGTTGAAAGGENGVKTQNPATAANAAHTHTVAGTTGSVSNEPPYLEVIFGKVTSTSSPVNDMIAMWDSTPDSSWVVLSTSTGAFYQVFPKGAATYGGTGGAASHTHADVNGIVSSLASATTQSKSTPPQTTAADHTHNVDVTGFSTDSHLPPYRNVIFAKRNAAGNSLPTASAVSVDSAAASINLTEGTTKTVSCAGTVTDNDGFADITSVTADFYRTAVGTSSALNNNNHYRLAGDANCVPSGGSGNSETYTCDFAVQYYADPTDAGSLFAAQEWTCTMTPVDATATGTAASDTIEMNTLSALSIPSGDPVNYGSVDPNNDTGGTNQSVTVRNTGNNDMDPELSGTNMTSGGDTILVGQQKYSATSFTYSSGGTALTASATGLDITLPQPTAGTVPVEDVILWGIGIPNGTPQGTYTGTITVAAAAGI
jgi:hypothetical protein